MSDKTAERSTPRCPYCGYTKEDAQIHGDHRLWCKNAGKAPWEIAPARPNSDVEEARAWRKQNGYPTSYFKTSDGVSTNVPEAFHIMPQELDELLAAYDRRVK